ncbi:hypothetical protein L3V43_19705 [Pseudoalteromonas sp. L23]|uniref:hypothetical protein n=1 Tax=unclassified Pseudoalteromonas TaxID=194690 RepID=UPI001EEFF241|nr:MULTISPECIES: hypothetical protein [unclassified Pseudoalteromonas]MCF7515840.1 hypothetical protein [Pseudoalteromonas sp. L7]MCF7527882.1 hypothetical protein [Pseudoalteromonas sp. L23]MCG7554527.1 hypothetical protein [Pseudoalteromonas sp. Of11M-6]MCX2768761.1 hypothetical protein [Pseudoalteromonas sp. B530]
MRRVIVVLGATLIASFVQAHSPEMIAQLEVADGAKCPKRQTILLGKMTLTAGTFKYLHSEGSNVCTSPKQSIPGRITPRLDCGQFDDWRLAYDMGNKMCQSLHHNMKGFSNSLKPDMTVYPRFEGPFEFKGDRHHQEYDAGMGVTLACYLCETATDN